MIEESPDLALPPNTRELLESLYLEFYGGPKAHADAYRILPRVIAALDRANLILPETKSEKPT